MSWRWSLIYFYQRYCDVQHTLEEVPFVLLILCLALNSVSMLSITQNYTSVNGLRCLWDARVLQKKKRHLKRINIHCCLWCVLKNMWIYGLQTGPGPIVCPWIWMAWDLWSTSLVNSQPGTHYIQVLHEML